METGYIATGFIVGLMIGLTGMGGGSLMTPILIVFFGIHPSAAVGTDLIFASLTKTVGAAVHGFRHSIAWGIVFRLSLGSLPAAAATLAALHHFGVHGHAANRWVSLLLGALLLVTAVALILKPWLLRLAERLRLGHGAIVSTETSARTTIAIGLALGVVVTVCSVGAGTLGTVALLILYPRLPMARIVGSDIAHAVPLTLLAGIGHWWLGSVDFPLLAPLLAGSVPGIVIGSFGARLAPEQVLQWLLALVLIFIGAGLLAG